MKSHLLRPNTPLIFVALLLFCCLSLSFARDQKDIATSQFPFNEIYPIQASHSRFYRIDLTNAPKDLDILITAVPAWGNSTPKIFASKSKEFPEKWDDDVVSTSGNVLLVGHKHLSKTLYICLTCGNSDCPTKFSVEWTKEISIFANGEKTIEDPKSLSRSNSLVVRLTIPKDKANRIVIYVDTLATVFQESPFMDILIGQGMTIPLTTVGMEIHYQMSGFGGNGLVIHKDLRFFCTDCVLTLNMKFTQSSAICIKAETFKEIPKLSGAVMLDAVGPHQKNLYTFTGKESQKEEDLILSVRKHRGRVHISMHCSPQPQFSADPYWQKLVVDFDEIVLPAKIRSRCSTENYFFMVASQEYSTYSIQVTYKQPNQFFIGGPRNYSPMIGELPPQDKVTYEIFVPTFSAEEIVLNFNFSQPLELDIINCRFSSDCPGIVERTRISYYNGFEEFKYTPEEISDKGLVVKINPKEPNSYPIGIRDEISGEETLPVYAYLITLSNSQSSTVQYSLKTEFQGPNLLRSGKSKFDIVTKGESLYYVFFALRKNIKSVQIQLTKFSGDPDIFISKIQKYPKEHVEEESGIQLSHEGMIICKSLYDPSGAYHIGIHGKETSSFSISAIIEFTPDSLGKSVVTQDSAFTLVPGRPQKGVLLPKNKYEAQYYKVFLDKDKNWQGSLHITVSSLSGHVLILANNDGKFPTLGRSMWSGKHNELVISSKDPRFKVWEFYDITIVVDQSAPYANLLADLVYHVTYSIIDDLSDPIHTFLSVNTPFYGVKQRNQPQYFEAVFLADQVPVTIYKYSREEIDIYVSTDPNNKYPSQDFCTETTKDQKKDSVTVKACEKADGNICSVYITVVSQKEASYSLSMRYESGGSAPIALEDGQQTHSVTPKNSRSPAVFYYYSVPSQTSVVTVSSSNREVLKIYARRIKVDIKLFAEPYIEPLQEIDAEFTSQGTDSFVAVPPLKDSDVTIVAISVYFKGTEEDYETPFTILASTQITQLFTKRPYSGFVAKDNYVYFMLEIFKPACTLLISLTNIDGDVDLLIGRGASARPTISNYQFAFLSDQITEVIQINSDDIPSPQSMDGIWIIGVYGDTSSAFNLTVIYEDREMIDLKPGTPVEMSFEGEYSFVYFKYNHEIESSLQITFTQISGQANFYMTCIDLDQDFATNIPNQAQNKWQILGSSGSITIPMQNYQACISCIYIMNIEAVSSSKFSLVLSQSEDPIPIENGLVYEWRLKPKKSAFYLFKNSEEDHEIQLNIEMNGTELNLFGSTNSSIDNKNYLWQENLTLKDPSLIIPLQKQTQKDSYYIILHNPTKQELNYSFFINPKTIKLDKLEQIYNLGPNEKKFFEFTYDAPTPVYEHVPWPDGSDFAFTAAYVEVIFYAVQKEGEKSQQNSMKSYLEQAREYRSQPLPRRSPLESDLIFFGLAPQVRSNASHAIARKSYQGRIPAGVKRFQVEIENPWEFKVSFRIYIGAGSLGRDAVHQIKTVQYEGDFSLSGVYFGDDKKGKWYLWAYSCDIAIDLKVENGDAETGMVTIPKGGSYLYKEADIESKLVFVRPNVKEVEQKGKYYIYSSVFDEEKFRDFAVKKGQYEIQLSQQRSQVDKKKKSQVTVKFKPVEFKGAASSDEVVYQVQLCGDKAPRFAENQFCGVNDGCVESQQVRFLAKQRDLITVNFRGVEDGRYSAKIKATFVHKLQPVKFAHPYVLGYIDVNYLVGDVVKPLLSWKSIVIVAGLGGVLAAVAFIGLRKLKNLKENKGLELQKMQIGPRQYNPLDEDGASNEDSNSEDKLSPQ